jgi:hypothetical protein
VVCARRAMVEHAHMAYDLVVLAVDRQPSKAQMADQRPLLPIVHKIRSARTTDMPPGSGDEINACTSQDN